MVLVGVFYYGRHYIVQPIEEEAQTLTNTVQAQQSLIDTYSPEKSLLVDYENTFSKIETYLPKGVQVADALVKLEQLAETSNVSIINISRLEEQQSLEEISEEFVKDIYAVQMTSDSPTNFFHLISHLMNEKRVWNITLLSYEKSGKNLYTGTINFELYYID